MSISPVGTESCDKFELEDRYYYPFSGKTFEFQRATYMDIMRLSKKNIGIVSELNKNWKNILKYEPEVYVYSGKVPDSFKKEGCFIIGFEDFALCCYIDITDFNSKNCAVFDVVQYID